MLCVTMQALNQTFYTAYKPFEELLSAVVSTNLDIFSQFNQTFAAGAVP